MAVAMAAIALANLAFAVHVYEVNPLETPPTHWDEGSAWENDGNAVIDTRSGRLQSVSQLHEGPYSGTPEEAAWEFLSAHKDWLGMAPTKDGLQVARSAESPGGYHVTFERVINGVRVYPGNAVVSFDRDMYATFYFSSLYLFDNTVVTTPAISSSMAIQIAKSYVEPQTEAIFGPETDLVVWAGDNRDFALCWRVLVNYSEESDAGGDWEIMVEASSGAILRAKDIAMAVNGTGYVFDPNPIVTSGMPYGSTGLTDNNDADSPQLTAQRFNRTLLDISSFPLFGTTYYYLTGPYCDIDDIEAPTIAPVIQAGSSAFNYTRSADAFEDVVTYYHIDKSQRWMRSLGFLSIQNAPLPCDPHAENFSCNAHYHPSGNYLTFGQGSSTSDADAAEDADVVLHEYGHAIHNSITPGWGGGDEGRLGEGWGDYWANSYSRSVSTYGGNWVVNWALQPCFGGRSMQAGLHYPEDNTGVHYGGQIWSQALHDAEININSRTVMNKVSLQSYYYYGTGASMLTAANAVITADQNLYSGSHVGGITTSFVARGLIDPPNNDECPGYTISALPYVGVGSTATAAFNYSHSCASSNAQDVVYTLSPAACPRDIVVSLCGSSYDTAVEIRYGGSCPGSFSAGCNDDYSGCGLQSQIAFTADANTTYYIIVFGFSTNSGSYNIAVTGSAHDPIPANDSCPGSTVISTLPYSDSGTTCGATNNYNTCVGTSSPEVVYTYTSPTCQTVTVSLCGSSYDTAIEVRSGGSCPGNTLVACNDDYCGLSSQVTFEAAANQTYYFFVHGYSTTSQGNYVLNVTSGGLFVPANDTCPGTTINSLPFTDNGNTVCANNDFANCIGTTSPDVVYNYTPLACGMVTVSLCGSNYDTAIEVRAGGDCPGLVRVNCNDDFCSLQSELTFFAEAGVHYYFIVHGFFTYAGPYTINVAGQSGGIRPNDACTGAYAITQLPYTDVGSTYCADNDNANCVGTNSWDVFYSLQLESCTEVTVSLCGSEYDTGLEIRSGGFTCPGTISIACNDDNYCGDQYVLQSTATFTALSGRPYWIIVHGYSGYAGPFIMNVTGNTCSPESLVVIRQNNDIYLDWAPVASSGSVTYSVYRTTTPDPQPIAANLIGTTANAFYTDANATANPNLQYYYIVTALGPTLLLDTPGDAAIASVQTKTETVEATTESMSFYLNPDWISGPNPDKPQPDEEFVPAVNWYGTLAPQPESKQVKN
ncbi:MAG: M36 family metallopeptidase [Calditrichaeota bacterium]|nr:M36 family metallopeptidase [Calditrichota bacterium]MCB9368835.1 M36 family metallopeptidase [Calditrichota bacterium]